MSSAGEFFKKNWWVILLIIFGLFIFMGVIYALIKLFNGPFFGGLGDVLGDAANLVVGIVNNCEPQADCPPLNSKNSCIKGVGCAWSPGDDDTPDDKPECLNNTGRKVGDGSFFSTSCLMGMGFIAYLSGMIGIPLLLGVGSLVKGFVAEKVKITSRLSGEPEMKVLKRIADKAFEITTKMKEKLKEGGNLSPQDEKDIASMASERANEIETTKLSKGTEADVDTVKAAQKKAQENIDAIVKRMNDRDPENSPGDKAREELNKQAEKPEPP